MDTKTIITIILLIFGLGIGLALDQEKSNTRPGWIHNVQWLDEQPDTLQRSKNYYGLK